MSIACLFFANDTMIFYEKDAQYLVYLRQILAWFKVVLSLCVHLGKSEMISVSKGEMDKTLAAQQDAEWKPYQFHI